MALSIYDFTKGLDFTALGSIAAGDHNNLVDLAQPYTDKGLVAETTDTGVNAPDVPNAATTTKWKKYLWKRIPHSASSSQTPFIYVWNDALPSVATYLKWVRITADTTTELALISALDARVTAVEASVVTALANAASATTNAALAVNDAAAAVATADGASANAVTAIANAATAQTSAVTAQADATTALTTSTAAQALASSASTNASNALAVSQDVTARSTGIILYALGTTIAPIAHGLGVVPKRITWVLVCITTDQGCPVGLEIPIDCVYMQIPDAFQFPAFQYSASSTYLYLTCGAYNTFVTTPAGVVITIVPVNWNLRCYYSKN